MRKEVLVAAQSHLSNQKVLEFFLNLHENMAGLGDQEVAGSTPPGLQHSFMRFDHEIFSTVILTLLLIQEGQLSVSGERICTVLVNCLED